MRRVTDTPLKASSSTARGTRFSERSGKGVSSRCTLLKRRKQDPLHEWSLERVPAGPRTGRVSSRKEGRRR